MRKGLGTALVAGALVAAMLPGVASARVGGDFCLVGWTERDVELSKDGPNAAWQVDRNGDKVICEGPNGGMTDNMFLRKKEVE
jgi:hypothetical protein